MRCLPFLTITILLSLICGSGCSPARTQQTDRPNFVLIFCDDLGYGDLGCFGSTKHRTPNIDRMAGEGRRFTSFYSTSGVCTPSRSSLMTGSYPRRVDMHEDGAGRWVLFPVGRKGLHPDEITVAEILRDAGYSTACIGKWHLGDQPQFLPTRQGFGEYYGIPYSNDMYEHKNGQDWPPLPLLRGETVVEAPADQITLTRRYTEAAVRYIEEHRDAPFFLYLPHAMPHNPVNASDRFRGESRNGGYGDAVEEIDWSTGQILDALDRFRLSERTLVVFTSDNGAASRWGGSNAPLSGWKGSTMEGGMRVPAIMRWPGTIPAGTETAELTATLDIMPTFARLAGAQPPSDRIIDGADISALLTSDAETPHNAYYYYQQDTLQAVRSGQWKLHLPRDGQAARLYDLEADIAETEDLAAQHQEIVSQLTTMADKARQDLGDGAIRGEGQREAGWVETALPLVAGPRPKS